MPGGWGGGFKPYVSVAEHKRQARQELEKRRKKGLKMSPVEIGGRAIAVTFWGKAWCRHLESYSDYANRLPRGRSYVRNGSVVHLEIAPGAIEALVAGSHLYKVTIQIAPLSKPRWRAISQDCSGAVASLVELLQGRLSQAVMERVCHKDQGLFPAPREIKLDCSCPDWAGMCKHVAAVLYGIGARFDREPELLFKLRGVDAVELIAEAGSSIASAETATASTRVLGANVDLGDVFGLDIAAPAPPAPAKRKAVKKAVKKAAKKKGQGRR